jgi:cytochrome c biogenesis protein CcmG/thiol:disulfide interchange protein DsbE
MGPRASVAVGVVVGLVIAALCGAVLVSLASGGAATITLAPSAPVTIAPMTATPVPLPSPTAGASASPVPSSSGVSIGDPGPVAGSPGVSTAPASPGTGDPASSATTGASIPPASARPVTPPPSPVTGSLFGVGKPAPPLAVTGLDGSPIDLASLRGHPVWVAFTGTYCPPCRDEYPSMESFALRYADTGLVVVAVHVKDDPAAVASLVQELGITFPVGLDPDGTAARDWRAVALPIHFWIDRDGIVRSGALGGVGRDAMAAGLATILPGVPITP